MNDEQLRRIDASIAEKFMGWGRINGGWHSPAFHGFKEVPHYSTDPLASKEVREKVAKTWAYQIFSPFNAVKAFSFGIGRKVQSGDFTFDYIAHANTEELAVSLAVLESIGLDVAEVIK